MPASFELRPGAPNSDDLAAVVVVVVEWCRGRGTVFSKSPNLRLKIVIVDLMAQSQAAAAKRKTSKPDKEQL